MSRDVHDGGSGARPWGRFLLAAMLACAADLSSKHWAFAQVEARGPIVVIAGWLQFIVAVNHAGMWSAFGEHGQRTNLVLIGFSSLVVLVLLGWGLFGLRAGDRMLAVILGMVTGGAAGNLHDRIRFDGVRDFIDAHYGEVYHYPTFNLADSFLVTGAIWLVAASLFGKRSDAATVPAPDSAAPAGGAVRNGVG